MVLPIFGFSGIYLLLLSWNISYHPKNGFYKASSIRIFLIFGIFDDFSKFCSAFGALHFEKKSSSMPKIWQKMKKSLVELAFKNPFLRGTSKTRNPDFG